jgi:hypothetical protein
VHTEIPDADLVRRTNSWESLWKAIAVIVLAATGAVAPVSAATLSVPSGYPTIQDAVNAANPGDTINVAAGTYNEQVVFSGKGPTAAPIMLTGAGAGQTIITPKAVPTAYPSVAGTTRTPMLYVYDSNVIINGLTLDGGATLPPDANGMYTVGVYFLNSNGALNNSEVKGLRCATWGPCTWEIAAVRVSNSASVFSPALVQQPDRTVTIENNDIYDFQSNGIFLTVDEGGLGQQDATKYANLIAYIRNNRITGSGPQAVAQNGIQIGGVMGYIPASTITGEVTGNTIRDFWYAADGYTSSGILSIAGTVGSGILFKSNTIINTQVGLHSEATAQILGNTFTFDWFDVPTSGCRASSIQIADVYSPGAPSPICNIQNDRIHYDQVGIEFGVVCAPGSVVSTNSITQYTWWRPPPTSTPIANYQSAPVDASNNWWGPGGAASDCCGPVITTPPIECFIEDPRYVGRPGFYPIPALCTPPTEAIPTLNEWALILLSLMLLLTGGWYSKQQRVGASRKLFVAHRLRQD